MYLELFGRKLQKNHVIRGLIAFVPFILSAGYYVKSYGVHTPLIILCLYFLTAVVPIRFKKAFTRDLFLGFSTAFFTCYFAQYAITLSFKALSGIYAEMILMRIVFISGVESILCTILIAGTLYMILRTFRVPYKVAAWVTPLPFLLFSAADYFVTSARGYELIALDLVNISTANNVVENYHFHLLPILFYLICPYILFILSVNSVRGKNTLAHPSGESEESSVPASVQKPKPKILSALSKRKDLAACVLSTVVLMGLSGASYMWFRSTHEIATFGFHPSHDNTFVMNFLYSIELFYPAKPDDYSISYINEQASAITQNAAKDEEWITDDVNIVVVMNEAYADMSIYQDRLTSYTDPAPFYQELMQDPNCINGYYLASIYGSNTANSEFEFLTGLSLGYINKGLVPFTTGINDAKMSLPYYLSGLGYTTLGMHPCNAANWSRDRVYPLLGFEEQIFSEDMTLTKADLIRKYVADLPTYKMLTEKLDTYHAQGKDKVFAFLVTLQNHGGFWNHGDFDNFSLTEYATADSTNGLDIDEMNCYLSLLKESDDALRYLIDYFRNADEKYVLFFFGDHQPSVTGLFDQAAYPQESYEVPFFLWANYDIPENIKASIEEQLIHTDKSHANVSMNYCALDVLRYAGLPLSPYYQTLSAIRKDVPIINFDWYYDRNNDTFEEIPDDGSPTPLMKLYSFIEYDVMYDKNDSDITRLKDPT